MEEKSSVERSDSILTNRQREIYEFIKNHITELGCPPSVREIATEFGIKSPNGVMCHLKALEKKGFIVREENAARAIRLAESVGQIVSSSARLSSASLDKLTERQRAIYKFIVNTITEYGYPPTVREIGGEFSISSPNGVMSHLNALQKKCLITRDPKSARGIRLVNSPLQLLNARTTPSREQPSSQETNNDLDINQQSSNDKSQPRLDSLIDELLKYL